MNVPRPNIYNPLPRSPTFKIVLTIEATARIVIHFTDEMFWLIPP